MKQVVVLGCGLVGRLIAKDLASDASLSVTVADRDEGALRGLGGDQRLRTILSDLSDAGALAKLLSGFDLAVGSLPGFLGLQTLRTVIETGIDYSDISFMPEDPLDLNELAEKRGVTAVVDCGVAPGMSNLIAGHAAATLDRLERILIVVGGLPTVRQWPFEYKAVFSPIDVIEEYTRPARYVEYGQVVEQPALSDVELIDLPGVGTLEAFNTDGLRSLARTLNAPHMKEKTLRYPGHAEKMCMLRDAGFFGYDPIQIKGAEMRPIDLTARLLFQMWRMQPSDRDLTVMRIVVEGTERGRRVRHTWDLLERFDEASGSSAMSRTTGFPCAIAARMIARGDIAEKGVLPPEILGKHETLFQGFMAGLAERGVRFTQTVEELSR